METTAYHIPAPLVDLLRQANHVVVLTGAGISAESGVPTFRQAQTGLWSRYNPEDLATPQAFKKNPRMVWEWYSWRRELVAQAQPNPGHYALVTLEQLTPRFTLITQNVDSLHQSAGSKEILELHGNISRVKCSYDGTIQEKWTEVDEPPPRCPDCGRYLRPDVVWFNEILPADVLLKAEEASQTADIFLTIGTSALVHPAASLPLVAIEAGAVTVEINPEETPLTPWMDHALRGPSGVILPLLVAAAWPN